MSKLLELAAVETPLLAAVGTAARAYIKEATLQGRIQDPRNKRDHLLQRKQFGFFLEHNPDEH